QIHCVDDQRTVAGILPDSVTELLNRLDRMLRQHFAPTIQACCCKIAVHPFDTGRAQRRDLTENVTDNGSGRIVGIDKDGKAESIVWHLLLFLDSPNECAHRQPKSWFAWRREPHSQDLGMRSGRVKHTFWSCLASPIIETELRSSGHLGS